MDQQSIDYYSNQFVVNTHWNKAYPNADEAERAGRILYVLSKIRAEVDRTEFDILDVGCGRGWLTNILTCYGKCSGIDPVPRVIEHARSLFPDINFFVGELKDYLSSGCDQFDVLVASEVIEHIPSNAKKDFLMDCRALLRERGHLIITTPRGELFDNWIKFASSTQPVEDWLTRNELEDLATSAGFKIREWLWCRGGYVYPNTSTKITRRVVHAILNRIGISAIDIAAEPIYQVVWLSINEADT